MSRGLPYSIVLHILLLGVVLLYGNAVNRPEVRQPHSIRVRMVELPKAPVTRQEPPAETPAEQPPQVQEAPPELPAKELPKPKPEPEKKPEKKPEKAKEKPSEPRPQAAPESPAAPADADADAAAVLPSGPAVEGTDVDFPFSWYLAQVQGQIARNWDPRQLGFRSRSVVSCVVHFTILKNGSVAQITLSRSSGVGVFDREALRVVQSSRMPPLPPGFAASTLGVSMKFNLESGI